MSFMSRGDMPVWASIASTAYQITLPTEIDLLRLGVGCNPHKRIGSLRNDSE